MVKRLLRGVEDYGSPFASDILKDYDDKEELLSHPSTLKLFRKELFMAGPVIDRLSRDMWKASGAKSARKRAKEQASKIIDKGSLRPIDDTLAKELKDVSIKHL
jgi:trimethylamine:corrinoid methyltransferase-like protein